MYFLWPGHEYLRAFYSKDIYDFLFDKDPKLAREFLSRFDFELREEVLSY